MNRLSLPLTSPTVRFGQIHAANPGGKSAEFIYEGRSYWVSNGSEPRDEDYDTYRDTESAHIHAQLHLNGVQQALAQSNGKRISLSSSNEDLLKDAQSSVSLAELALNGLKRQWASQINPAVDCPAF